MTMTEERKRDLLGTQCMNCVPDQRSGGTTALALCASALRETGLSAPSVQGDTLAGKTDTQGDECGVLGVVSRPGPGRGRPPAVASECWCA